jgi:hypothetical protein
MTARMTTTPQRANCSSHCSACGLHFHSEASFDRHRRGEYQPEDGGQGRHCISPHDDDALDRDGEPYFVALSEDGVCRMHPEDVREGVTVWTDRKRLEKTRAHYRGTPETPTGERVSASEGVRQVSGRVRAKSGSGSECAQGVSAPTADARAGLSS